MGKVLTPNDINALIHLLGDDDPWVQDQARAALREANGPVQPHLEIAAETNIEEAIREAADRLLEDLRFDAIEQEWAALRSKDDGVALEEGALLLERTLRAGRDAPCDAARAELDRLGVEAARELEQVTDPRARVEALRVFIHDTCGFHGNTEDYYDVENSFLTSVLSRREGIPITLALLYLAIGRRAGVPLVGVSMPMHFLVAHRTSGAYRYLDPFYGGREVGRGECLLLLERAGFHPPEPYLHPSPAVTILERMARNLIVIFQHGAERRDLERARRFVSILKGDEAKDA